MKLTITITLLTLLTNFCFSQEASENQSLKEETAVEEGITKSDLIGTWRACGNSTWDEDADTLSFQHATPDCRDNECGEHNWSFRETGSVEFIFTDGCATGFHSVSKNPKRWLFIEKDKRIKMITNDGFVEYFDVHSLDEKLVLIHRKDLELN